MCLFGDICKKFESVCYGVDEVVSHESIKYIERKVQNVGENVIKFYAKIAQVIVTPMMDEDEFSELDEEINQLQEQQDAEIISYYTIDTQSNTVDDDDDQDQDEEASVEHLEESSSSDLASSTLSSSSSNGTIPIEEIMLRNLLQAFHLNFITEITTASPSIALQNNANTWFSAYSNLHIHSSSFQSSFASSSGSSPAYESMLSSHESSDLEKEAKELCDDQAVKQVEESCVIVDYTTTPHHVVSSQPLKHHPSFKEKILNALSSKKRLEGEYKEIANWDRENTTKGFQGTSSTMHLRDSETIHLSGSEWELL